MKLFRFGILSLEVSGQFCAGGNAIPRTDTKETSLLYIYIQTDKCKRANFERDKFQPCSHQQRHYHARPAYHHAYAYATWPMVVERKVQTGIQMPAKTKEKRCR